MSAAIFDLLRKLYGPDNAAHLQTLVDGLIERSKVHRAAGNPAPVKQSPSREEALLITYADQVQDRPTPPLQALREFASRYLKDLISGIHILPFYPSSSDDGFSVMDYFSVDPAYGTWEDIKQLGEDFHLMFDGVVNHASVQGEWFKGFLQDDPKCRDFFVVVEDDPPLHQVVRPRTHPLLTTFETAAGPKRVWTTFSTDQADLDFANPLVLIAIMEVLLFYVCQGARYIRLDAIAFLWKQIGTPCLHLPQTHQVVQLFRAVLAEAAPEVRLITETNVPHDENISYFGDGTNEAHLVYNFALPPLVLHSMQTGSAQKLSTWASSLRTPGSCTTYFNFLSSHDGIGLNPARGILSETELQSMVSRTVQAGGLVSHKAMPDGSRRPYELNVNLLDALSPREAAESSSLAVRKFLTAHAIMLCLQGVPGIYFHSLFGSRGDPEAAALSGQPRRINRQKLDRKTLEAELNDRCSLRHNIFGGWSSMLAARRSCTAFDPGAAQEILNLDPKVFGVMRTAFEHNEQVLCLHNVSSQTVRLNISRLHSAGGPVGLPPYATQWLIIRRGETGAHTLWRTPETT